MTGNVIREKANSLRRRLEEPFDDVFALASTLEDGLGSCLGFDSTQTSQLSGISQSACHTFDAEAQVLFVQKFLPIVQQNLLATILIDWEDQLRAENLFSRCFQPWFLPEEGPKTAVAMCTLAVASDLLSFKVQPEIATRKMHVKTWSFLLDLLPQLLPVINLQPAFSHIFLNASKDTRHSQRSIWNNHVKTIFSLPVRLANAKEAHFPHATLDRSLEWGPWMSSIASNFAALIEDQHDSLSGHLDVIAELLGKFITVGYVKSASSQRWPNFWADILPYAVRTHDGKSSKESLYSLAMAQMPPQHTSTAMASLFTYLLSTLLAAQRKDPYSRSHEDSSRVSAAARVLQLFFGPLVDGAEAAHVSESTKIAIQRTLINHQWTQPLAARILLSWCLLDRSGSRGCVEWLLQSVLDIWEDKTNIEKADLDNREYLTFLLLLCIDYLPARSPIVRSIASSAEFLQAVQTHLSTMRPSIRHLGMLTAEIVSNRSLEEGGPVAPLDFGKDVWDNASTTAWRSIRSFLTQSPAHERSEDMTINLSSFFSDLNVSNAVRYTPQVTPKDLVRDKPSADFPPREPKKPARAKARPIIQVLDALSTSDDEEDGELQPLALPDEDVDEAIDVNDLSTFTPQKKKVKPPVYIADLSGYLRANDDAEKTELGLKHAAPLIRKKAGWGKELEEHAVDLAFALISMHDKFDLDNFDAHRREALVALNIACPTKIAPTIIEQYFLQHYSIAQKVAMLYSLMETARALSGLGVPIDGAAEFPSKQLPSAALHNHLIASNSENQSLEQYSRPLLADILGETRTEAEERLPAARRENVLTTRSRARMTANTGAYMAENRYLSLADRHFVMPLINRLWKLLSDAPQYANDGQTFSDLKHHPLFGAVLLSNYFHALCVLLDLSRHSTSFQHILVPETLEVVLAASGINQDTEVVAAEAQLCLIAINGANRIDKGRALLRSHRELVFAVKDWAEGIWAETTGSALGKAEQAVAGLLLSLDSIINPS